MKNQTNAYELLVKYIESHQREIARKEMELSEQKRKFESDLVLALKGALAPEQSEEPNPEMAQIDRRPRITQYQYRKARDEGMTYDEIKTKFRLDNPNQLGGFEMQYRTLKSKASTQPPQEPTASTQISNIPQV